MRYQNPIPGFSLDAMDHVGAAIANWPAIKAGNLPLTVLPCTHCGAAVDEPCLQVGLQQRSHDIFRNDLALNLRGNYEFKPDVLGQVRAASIAAHAFLRRLALTPVNQRVHLAVACPTCVVDTGSPCTTVTPHPARTERYTQLVCELDAISRARKGRLPADLRPRLEITSTLLADANPEGAPA